MDTDVVIAKTKKANASAAALESLPCTASLERHVKAFADDEDTFTQYAPDLFHLRNTGVPFYDAENKEIYSDHTLCMSWGYVDGIRHIAVSALARTKKTGDAAYQLAHVSIAT